MSCDAPNSLNFIHHGFFSRTPSATSLALDFEDDLWDADMLDFSKAPMPPAEKSPAPTSGGKGDMQVDTSSVTFTQS